MVAVVGSGPQLLPRGVCYIFFERDRHASLPCVGIVPVGVVPNFFIRRHRSTSASLPAQSFWDKFKPKGKDVDMRDRQAQMALARQRLLTLVFGDMETIRMVSLLLTRPHLTDSISAPWQLRSKALSHPVHSSPNPLVGTRSCGARLDKASA